MRFVKVSEDAFKEMQLEAGLILNKFDTTGKTNVEDADIVCATTGGINIVCKPTFTDYGADIDNVPNNMLEFKEIDGWDCSLGFTALNASASFIKIALCAADVDGNMLFYTSRSQVLKIMSYFEMLKNGEIIPEI